MKAPILRIEFHFADKTKFKRGTCIVCGCRDRQACPGGCAWVDRAHYLCSACVLRALEGVDLEEPTHITRTCAEEGKFVTLTVEVKQPKAPRRRKGARK